MISRQMCQIQIHQEQLDHFLIIAQRFQLQGLIQEKEEAFSDLSEDKHFPDTKLINDDSMVAVSESAKIEMHKEKIISVESFNFESIEELDQKVQEMMERQPDGKYKCLTCEKIGRKVHMKEHVEIHIDGLSFPCQQCDKTFRSRNSLRGHQYSCRKI